MVTANNSIHITEIRPVSFYPLISNIKQLPSDKMTKEHKAKQIRNSTVDMPVSCILNVLLLSFSKFTIVFNFFSF
jgi:hypothetical protein